MTRKKETNGKLIDIHQLAGMSLKNQFNNNKPWVR